jgi:predicted DNA-binding protein YlxM (UPF0122 family)
MKQDEVISTILGCSVSGYYKWKKENRVIILLLEKYFTKEQLEEFLKTGKINKQELIKDFSLEDLENFNKIKEQLILEEIARTEEKLLALKSQLNIH